MILYGPPGSGKSSMAAYFPDPLFVIHPKERGIKTLISRNQVRPVDILEFESWPDLLSILKEAASNRTDHSYKTLILDSLTWIEQECFNTVCHELFEDDWGPHGFYSFYTGPRKAAQKYWPAYIDALMALAEAGINVIQIAHAKVANAPNPAGADFIRWQPRLENDSWSVLHAASDMVLFINRNVEVSKESKIGKGKATGGQRFLETDWSPAFEAKSKGLPYSIEMGNSGQEAFNNFWEAYSNPE